MKTAARMSASPLRALPRAEDASTAFHNPAGMTRLKQQEAVTNAEALYIDLQFDPNGATTTSGSD